jgi:O-antigen/teichoic acid export membrane protein
LLIVVVAAPVFGAAVFGEYQFATTVAALVTTSTELGLGTWTTRALARDGGHTGSIVAAGMRLRLLTVVPCAVVLGIVALLQTPGEARRAVALLGVAALAGSFVDYFGAILRGLEDFRREAATNIARAVLTTAGALGGLLVARSLTGLATGLLGGALASFAFGWRILGGRSHDARPESSRRSPHIPVRALLPLWLAGLLSTLYFRCDIVLLRLFVSDAEIGNYGAAYRIFEALMLAPSTIMAVAFPRLARTGAAPHGWTRLEVQLLGLLAGLGGVVAAGLYTFSDPLVHVVFGADFARAAMLLRVLAFSAPPLFLNFALTFFLFARGRERDYLVIVAIMVVLNVALNLIAIPHLGSLGAAWATLATETALATASVIALAGRRASLDGPARSA